jgi:hypothetical protein
VEENLCREAEIVAQISKFLPTFEGRRDRGKLGTGSLVAGLHDPYIPAGERELQMPSTSKSTSNSWLKYAI